MASTPHIRPLQPEDIPSVNALFTTVFGKHRSIEYWMWKYFSNPHGDAIVSVAEVSGEVVGLYGLVPRKTWWVDEKVTAWQEVDLMVHPEHGKGGLFKHLGNASYQRVTAAKHPFTFGFPNQTSLPLGRRILGWRAISPIPLWTMLLKPSEALAEKVPSLPGAAYLTNLAFRTYHDIRLGGRSTQKITIETTFPDDINSILVDRKAELEFIRDADYLHWRYVLCPTINYRIYRLSNEEKTAAVAVIGLGGDGRANLCDLLFHPSMIDGVPGLIRRVADDCRSAGCQSLRSWAIAGNPEAEFYASCGFFNRDALNFHVIRSFISPEQNRKLWDPARWFVSAGDSDCV